MADSPDATVRTAYNGNWYAKLTRADAIAPGPFAVTVAQHRTYAVKLRATSPDFVVQPSPAHLPYLHSSAVVITCQRFNFVQASVHFRVRFIAGGRLLE